MDVFIFFDTNQKNMKMKKKNSPDQSEITEVLTPFKWRHRSVSALHADAAFSLLFFAKTTLSRHLGTVSEQQFSGPATQTAFDWGLCCFDFMFAVVVLLENKSSLKSQSSCILPQVSLQDISGFCCIYFFILTSPLGPDAETHPHYCPSWCLSVFDFH